jgi:hypothetical protein
MKLRFTFAIPVAMLGALLFVLPAGAQRSFAARPAPAGRAALGASFGRGGRGAFRPTHPLRPTLRGRGRGRGWGPGWGWEYLPYADYYDYSDYEPAMTEAPPRESTVQPAQAAPPEREIHPLVIERQGDQWVQITGYGQSPAPAQPAPPKTVEATRLRGVLPSRTEAAEPPRELPPAVLVFRDGHEEEVKSYTIIGKTLFTSANYWISGSWTRKIELANLDVPATLKRNQDRGSKFRLPSGPEEVVIRP